MLVHRVCFLPFLCHFVLLYLRPFAVTFTLDFGFNFDRLILGKNIVLLLVRCDSNPSNPSSDVLVKKSSISFIFGASLFQIGAENVDFGECISFESLRFFSFKIDCA
eukprot:60348_1